MIDICEWYAAQLYFSLSSQLHLLFKAAFKIEKENSQRCTQSPLTRNFIFKVILTMAQMRRGLKQQV